MFGGASLPRIYDLCLCCLYIDVKENIICQNLRFFLLFMESLLCQKPNVSTIISNVSEAVVTAVTACVSDTLQSARSTLLIWQLFQLILFPGISQFKGVI